MTCAVPTMRPCTSSAATTMRSPRATLAETLRQNASALARDIGSMKLTEAPPSTQSMSTSLRPWISRSPMLERHRIRTAFDIVISVARAWSSPWRPRALGGDEDDIARGPARAVAKRGRLVELHREAVVGGQTMRHFPDGHLDRPLLDPDLLMNAHVARAGLVGDSGARWQQHFDDLDRRRKIRRRDIAPHIAGLRIAPWRSIFMPGHGIDRGLRVVEQGRERHTESGGDLLQQDRRRAALAALNQRDHRPADVRLRSEAVERHAAVRAKGADAAGDAGVDTVAGGTGHGGVFHSGRIVQ